MAIGNIGFVTDSIPNIRHIFGGNLQESRAPEKTKRSTLPKNVESKALQQDTVELSPEAQKALEKDKATEEKKSVLGNELSDSERKEVEKLKRRDSQVRRHEMAHKMSGGSLTGQINYEYETGPDGKRYAVGGHISIDTSEASTPEATLRKAAAVKRAALAPSDPSPADRGVAQKAQAMAAEARQEVAAEQQEKMAEQMAGMGGLASGGAGNIDVDMEKIFSAKLKGAEEASTVSSVPSITPAKIKKAYQENSSEASQQPRSRAKSQNIKISTSAPSKGRLSEGEENMPEEAPPPEVSPVE